MAPSPEDRIEQALARIETAAAARAYATARLARRHAKLRTRIEEAVSSLDVLIARESTTAEAAD
jgi:phage shock protein A